jgi:hypothetical protein
MSANIQHRLVRLRGRTGATNGRGEGVAGWPICVGDLISVNRVSPRRCQGGSL